MLDSQLTMSAQVGAACRSAYNYLRQLRPVVRTLSHLCLRASTAATLCCSMLPTAWFNVFKLFKMLPHVSSVALANPSTSRQYWDNFTGYRYGNVLNLRWPFWCTRHWTACHHSTWRMTVNSSQPLAAGDFDRLMSLPATFHEPAQLWAIDPSLLLVHICGTIYHFISVTLNYRFPSFAGYWKRICLAEDHGA